MNHNRGLWRPPPPGKFRTYSNLMYIRDVLQSCSKTASYMNIDTCLTM